MKNKNYSNRDEFNQELGKYYVKSKNKQKHFHMNTKMEIKSSEA